MTRRSFLGGLLSLPILAVFPKLDKKAITAEREDTVQSKVSPVPQGVACVEFTSALALDSQIVYRIEYENGPGTIDTLLVEYSLDGKRWVACHCGVDEHGSYWMAPPRAKLRCLAVKPL